MSTTVTVRSDTEPNSRVRFEDLNDGDWFVSCGFLGVKVDGRGFYPAVFDSPHRGNGVSDLKVLPVSSVEITFVT